MRRIDYCVSAISFQMISEKDMEMLHFLSHNAHCLAIPHFLGLQRYVYTMQTRLQFELSDFIGF